MTVMILFKNHPNIHNTHVTYVYVITKMTAVHRLYFWCVREHWYAERCCQCHTVTCTCTWYYCLPDCYICLDHMCALLHTVTSQGRIGTCWLSNSSAADEGHSDWHQWPGAAATTDQTTPQTNLTRSADIRWGVSFPLSSASQLVHVHAYYCCEMLQWLHVLAIIICLQCLISLFP